MAEFGPAGQKGVVAAVNGKGAGQLRQFRVRLLHIEITGIDVYRFQAYQTLRVPSQKESVKERLFQFCHFLVGIWLFGCRVADKQDGAGLCQLVPVKLVILCDLICVGAVMPCDPLHQVIHLYFIKQEFITFLFGKGIFLMNLLPFLILPVPFHRYGEPVFRIQLQISDVIAFALPAGIFKALHLIFKPGLVKIRVQDRGLSFRFLFILSI